MCHGLSLEPMRSVDLEKHSVYTHFPSDRNCEIGKRTKITRVPCTRRNGEAVPRAANFGDLIIADHKVLSDNCESRNNHRFAIVVQDLATQWIQTYPCKAKTSQETQRSLQKFLEPNKQPKVIYTDNSLEFGKACEDLSWDHCTSTPHRSETNGIAERAVWRVKEDTSAVLLQSGLGHEWLADSMECYRVRVSTLYQRISRKTQIVISAWRRKLQGLLAEDVLVQSCPERNILVTWSQRITKLSVKKVNRGTIRDLACFADTGSTFARGSIGSSWDDLEVSCLSCSGFHPGSVEVLSSTKFYLNSCSQSSNSCDISLCTSSRFSVLFLFSVSVDSCNGFTRTCTSFWYWIFGVSVCVKYGILWWRWWRSKWRCSWGRTRWYTRNHKWHTVGYIAKNSLAISDEMWFLTAQSLQVIAGVIKVPNHGKGGRESLLAETSSSVRSCQERLGAEAHRSQVDGCHDWYYRRNCLCKAWVSIARSRTLGSDRLARSQRSAVGSATDGRASARDRSFGKCLIRQENSQGMGPEDPTRSRDKGCCGNCSGVGDKCPCNTWGPELRPYREERRGQGHDVRYGEAREGDRRAWHQPADGGMPLDGVVL